MMSERTAVSKNHLKSFIAKDGSGVLLILIVFIIVVSVLTQGKFLSANNITNLLRSISVLGVMCCAITLVMITGNIDLSVGSLLSLCACISATMVVNSLLLAIAVPMLVGLAAGFINGFLVGKMKLNPFIITLGMLSVYKAFTLLYANNRYLVPDENAAYKAIKAMTDLQALDYWQSWQGFADILADDSLKGFVQDQARLRQMDCEQAMHQPLLASAELLMAGGRYLSAQAALTKIAAVFTDDTVIKADLAECASHVPAKLENYSSTIEVISVKPLIVSPARAFDGDAYAAAANDAMLTTGEFSKMLAELYANNYILID